MKKILISKVFFTFCCIIILSIVFAGYKVNATTNEQAIKIHDEEEKIIKYDVETGEYSEVDMEALIEKNRLFKATRKTSINATEPYIPNTLQDIDTYKSNPMRITPVEDLNRIYNTNEYPYKFTCKIRINGEDNVGTGFIVGPNMMLTAAHNLYDGNNEVRSLEVCPAYNGTRLRINDCFVSCTWQAIYRSSLWLESNKKKNNGDNSSENNRIYNEYDWALVELRDAEIDVDGDGSLEFVKIGNFLGWYGIIDYNNESFLNKLNVKALGYPEISNAAYQYYTTGTILNYEERYFMCSNGNRKGMSGGPIIPDLEEWKYYSVGILKGANFFDQTYAIRITEYLINLVRDNINTLH